MRQALSVVVAGLVIGALASSASATPSGDLDAARRSFRERDWDRTVKLATSLIYPNETLNSPDDLVEAHVLLGASKYELGDLATAKTEFQKALEIERDRELTHNVFSDGVVKLFDDTKAEIERQDRLREQQEKDAIKQQQVENFLANAHLYEAHPYIANFVPFGAGQFFDHRRVRGTLLATTEGLTLGASVGIWYYLVSTYGISASNVPLSEAQTVRTLQQIEIGTGIAFFSIYAFGVVDALIHYRPRAQIESDDSLLPPELRPKKPKKTSLLERIHIVPMASRTGAGLGLGWEN